jgi:hypothetical protein
VVNPPTIAPACAAAERRHLGVWSACAAEGKCIAPYAHIVLLDLVCARAISALRARGHHNAILGSGVLHTHLRTCWPPADALLYGVLETCARPRADLRQVLSSRTVFSSREPAKIG